MITSDILINTPLFLFQALGWVLHRRGCQDFCSKWNITFEDSCRILDMGCIRWRAFSSSPSKWWWSTKILFKKTFKMGRKRRIEGTNFLDFWKCITSFFIEKYSICLIYILRTTISTSIRYWLTCIQLQDHKMDLTILVVEAQSGGLKETTWNEPCEFWKKLHKIWQIG